MKRPKYKYVLALIDFVLINAAFIIALNMQADGSAALLTSYEPYVSGEILFFLLYSFIVVLIFQHNNLYKISVFLTIADHSVRIFQSIIYAILGLAILSFFTKSSVIVESRLAILSFTALSLGLLALFRVFLFRSLFLLFVSLPRYRRSMVILGAGPTGKLLAANVRLNNPYGLHVVGFLDDTFPEGTLVFGGLKVLAKVSDVAQVVETLEISEVLVCLDDVPHDLLQRVLDMCMKTPAQVKVASPLYDIITERMFTERYGKVPVVGIRSSPSIAQTLLKRVFDILFAGIGLLLVLPVFAVIALAIKLDSPGGVFFKQIRVGKGGKRFVFYKFRSMTVGSDNDDRRRHEAVSFIRAGETNGNGNGSTKIVNQSRVTRVGWLLRKMSLDELPQLINVIRGEMSLVGPRPCLPYEWENYDEWHKKRLSVTPGCTGVWQVSGRSEVGFDDMVVLDLYYIQNASLLLDFQLILKTIPVMLFAKGAK